MKLQQLVHAAQLHSQVWTELTAKLVPLAERGDSTPMPPHFSLVYRNEFLRLREIEKQRREAVNQILSILRMPLMQTIAFVPDGDLNDFQRKDIEPTLRHMVENLTWNTSTAMSPELADQYRAVVVALKNGELLYPLSQRVTMASNLVQHSIPMLMDVLALVAIFVLLCIATVWRMALEPALRLAEQSSTELLAQNQLLLRSEEKIASAQRIAKVCFWFIEPSDSALNTMYMEQVLGLAPTALPQSLRQLAALSGEAEAQRIFNIYRQLEQHDGVVDITRSIFVAGHEVATVHERIESSTRADGRHILGTLLEISEITKANNQLARLERVKIIELLISGIAHDFNNMLAIIQGNAESALASPANNSAFVQAILVANRSAAALIQQLQAQPQDGQSQQEPIALAESLRGVLAALHTDECRHCTIELLDSGSPSDYAIRANKGLFANAVFNIVKNACEATGGNGQITISVNTIDASAIAHSKNLVELRGRLEPFVCVRTTDNGPGMDNATQRQALEPFFSTKGARRGLGLWSVYSFMKACKGAMHIESRVGHGTTIDLYFPLATPLAPATSPTPPTHPASRLAGHPGKILIVEDDNRLAAILLQQMSLLGYQAMKAATAAEALALAQSEPELQLVVADVNLGDGSSGVALVRALKQQGTQLKFVLMSGVGPSDGDTLAEVEAGTQLLIKPFSLKLLDQTVRALLKAPA